MFKGILPPRRVPTPEFTIVSPLIENGKENLPTSPALHPEASPIGKVAVKSGKAAAAAQDKPKRKKGGDVPPNTAPIANFTDREFDRLLVRAIAVVSQSHCSRFRRTTSKFHPRFARSLLAWSRPSRRPCSSHLRSSCPAPHRRPHVASGACKAAAPSTSSRHARVPPQIISPFPALPGISHPHLSPNIPVAFRSTFPAQNHAQALRIWAATRRTEKAARRRRSRPCSTSAC